MTLNAATFSRRTTPPAGGPAGVQRYPRFVVNLRGRFMRSSKQEFACRLQDISVDAATLMTDEAVERNERIIAYFEQLGGLEGDVVSTFDGGFSMRLAASQHRREKLAAQITWLINSHELSGAEARRHDRIPVVDRNTALKLAEGVVVPCSLNDVSLSGASVGTTARPAIGSEVLLGKLRARVMRHHEHGIGVQFLDIQEPEALRRYFG
jgi:hypothetical protein